MSFETLLNNTCTIVPITQGEDAMGGVTETPGAGRSVRCRVRQLSESEREVVGREGRVSTHRIYLRGTETLGDTDVINVGSEVHDIGRVNDAGGRMGHHLEVDTVRRN